MSRARGTISRSGFQRDVGKVVCVHRWRRTSANASLKVGVVFVYQAGATTGGAARPCPHQSVLLVVAECLIIPVGRVVATLATLLAAS